MVTKVNTVCSGFAILWSDFFFFSRPDFTMKLQIPAACIEILHVTPPGGMDHLIPGLSDILRFILDDV